jgi:hypothetical protein
LGVGENKGFGVYRGFAKRGFGVILVGFYKIIRA